MTKYFVITPQYEDRGLDYLATAADVVEVEAETKAQAKVLGLRELRRIGSGWLQMQGSEHCPFTGLKVEKVDVDEEINANV